MPANYRADIDGLRGVSALAVMFFHAQVPGFRGGFVGVDVFFVISGYLITRLLQEPGDQPLMRRLGRFYARRCRRILPALFALLLIVSVVATLLLRQDALRIYGRYLASTSVFLTNFAAWSDRSAGWPALIHLWSIAVEEQFYLFYPLLLAMPFARGPLRVPTLAALAVGSFVLALWMASAAPLAGFYLTAPRGWELLLGGLAALIPLRIQTDRTREWLAVAAITVIVLGCSSYSPASHRLPLLLLPVCLACVALLVCGQDGSTCVQRLLSSPPLVLTGLISYSLYLWHAPVLAWSYYRTGASPGALQSLALLPAIWLLALVSWLAVERPLRKRRVLASDVHMAVVAVTINCLLGCLGLYLWLGRPT